VGFRPVQNRTIPAQGSSGGSVQQREDDVNAALEAAHLPRDTMTLVFKPIVVNTGSKLVAIDTGYGAA
jgi:hypothetical protein